MANSFSLNFYPSRQEISTRGPGGQYAGFSRKDFETADLEDLREAAVQIGGVLRFLPGSGPGMPGTVGVREVTFSSEGDAIRAGHQLISWLSPTLGSRLTPTARITPRKRGG